ncbi:MAG: alpha/beta hydrolase [Chloroflexi bacterium]|nr:alpha/beta hydrolase [Chloroflexota bacterium]
MTVAIDKTVTVGNLRFHYRDWGGSGPVIVLLHDLGASAHSWDLVGPLLAGRQRVFAVDMRGHGLSDKPESGYTIAQCTKDLLAVLNGLQTKKAIVAGHGWGAALGLQAAAQAPKRVVALIHVGAGFGPRNQADLETAYAPPDQPGMFASAFRERLIAGSPHGLMTPAVEAALMASCVIDEEDRVFPRLPENARRALIADWAAFQPADLLKHLSCPLLVAVSQGDTLSPTLPDDAVVARLEDAQLPLPLQRPHGLAGHVQQFLQEHV